MCVVEMVRLHQQLGTTKLKDGILAGAVSLMQSPHGMFRGTWIGWMKTFPEFLVKNLVLSSMRTAQGGAGEPRLAGMLPRVLASTISARLITYPFEVCKLRVMQYEGPKPYSGLYDTGRRIVIEEGISGLFKGLSMGLAANIVYSITMSLVSPWTHSLAAQFGIPPELSLHVSRLVSTLTSYPFETVKRRVAANCQWVPPSSLPASYPADPTPLNIFRQIIASNWMQLWAGFPLHATSLVLKPFLVRFTHLLFDRLFIWNNGYTVSIFDSTPLPGVSQFITPDELLRRKRYDNRV